MRLLAALIFLAGLVALVARIFGASRRGPPKTGVPAPESNESARPPELLTRSDGQTLDFASTLADGNGFPLPDWDQVATWTDTGEEPASARNQARRAWLLHLAASLDGLSLTETRDALVLSSFPRSTAQAVARFVVDVRGRILGLLDGIAEYPRGEQSVLLLFDEQDDYYRYVANYYPEDGEFAYSGGMFIKDGCPHFVSVKIDLSMLEPVIAHELTHNSLAHLSLPLWLDEGIAVNTERHLIFQPSNAQEAIDRLTRHHGFWNAERVQEFWSGESFQRTDDGNELSYDMARHIVDLLGRDWPMFTRFVRSARREDAGAAALRAEFDLDLGQLAATAIGMKEQPGWSPRPETWASIREKARS